MVGNSCYCALSGETLVMSQRALLVATRDFIRSHLKFDKQPLRDSLCEIMPDGRPPPFAGEFFVSVHAGGFKGQSTEDLDVNHQLNITITWRCAFSPYDKQGLAVIVREPDGLLVVAQTLMEMIHNNWFIINNANFIIKDTVNKFVEPLRFSFASPVRPVSANWFHANEGSEVGMIQSLTFGEARRVQYGTYQPFVELPAGYPPHGVLPALHIDGTTLDNDVFGPSSATASAPEGQ